MPKHLCLLIIPLLLNACASSPAFDTTGVNRSLTPQSVATGTQAATGKQVLWGGSIISTTNLKDRTQIEVLAYPLDTNSRPLSGGNPQGRFILEQAGYLEPVNYAQGRLLTVSGTVTGSRTGKVGDSDYDFPVVQATQLNLWPKEQEEAGPGIHFGIGAGSGGSTWGGVGIGF